MTELMPINLSLALAAFAVLGGVVLAGGFALGWWLRARVSERIDDERENVAQQVAKAVMGRCLKPGPN